MPTDPSSPAETPPPSTPASPSTAKPGSRPKRTRWFHPLCGADPMTILRVVGRNGLPTANRLPQLAIAFSASLGRLPFSLIERVLVSRKIASGPPLPPPIFILGHWRSGTTHLYNVMSKADHFGFVPPLATGLPWDMLVLAKLLEPWLEKLLPSERYIDKIPVKLDSPQEDEAALANMQPISFYHGLYFPRRLHENFQEGVFLEGVRERDIARWEQRFAYLLHKLAIKQPDRWLLIKNPVYTARVDQLLRLFPDARFIHIHRNPWIVFQSMRRFYLQLVDELSLQRIAIDEQAVETLVIEGYQKMMGRLVEQTPHIPAGRFIELSFDELERDAIGSVARIHEQLELPGFDAARPRFEAYLESIQGYRKNRVELTPAQADRVGEACRPWIERWGYQRPG